MRSARKSTADSYYYSADIGAPCHTLQLRRFCMRYIATVCTVTNMLRRIDAAGMHQTRTAAHSSDVLSMSSSSVWYTAYTVAHKTCAR
eukprot:14635-Heterococcus_DN1.PRE.2